MESIKKFEDKKIITKNFETIKGGKRTPTQNSDLVIFRGSSVHLRTNHDMNPFNNDGW